MSPPRAASAAHLRAGYFQHGSAQTECRRPRPKNLRGGRKGAGSSPFSRLCTTSAEMRKISRQRRQARNESNMSLPRHKCSRAPGRLLQHAQRVHRIVFAALAHFHRLTSTQGESARKQPHISARRAPGVALACLWGGTPQASPALYWAARRQGRPKATPCGRCGAGRTCRRTKQLFHVQPFSSAA